MTAFGLHILLDKALLYITHRRIKNADIFEDTIAANSTSVHVAMIYGL